MTSDELLTVEEVSAWLRIPVTTLKTWRSKGRGHGLPTVRLGNHVRYRRADVEAFLDANTRAGARPTRAVQRGRRAG